MESKYKTGDFKDYKNCHLPFLCVLGFPGSSAVKNLPANADVCLIPGSRRTPGDGKGNPLQYSCLENPTVRGAWQAIVQGVAKESDTTSTQQRNLVTFSPDFFSRLHGCMHSSGCSSFTAICTRWGSFRSPGIFHIFEISNIFSKV